MKLVHAVIGVSLIWALAGTAYFSYGIGYSQGRIDVLLETIQNYQQKLDSARRESQEIFKLPDSVSL